MIEMFKHLHRFIATHKLAPPKIVLMFDNQHDADRFASHLHVERLRDDPGAQVTQHTKDHTPTSGTVMGIKFEIRDRGTRGFF